MISGPGLLPGFFLPCVSRRGHCDDSATPEINRMRGPDWGRFCPFPATKQVQAETNSKPVSMFDEIIRMNRAG
jgi:hypothetical protein